MSRAAAGALDSLEDDVMLQLTDGRDRPAWPWALAVIPVLVVVVWMLLPRGGATDGGTIGALSTGADPADRVLGLVAARRTPADGTPAPVRAFLRFAADPLAPHAASVSHEYAVGGLRLLADALDAAAGAGAGQGDSTIERSVELVRRRTDALQHGARWSEHTRYAREAFLAAGDAIAALRARGALAGGPGAAGVWRAAACVEVDRGLIEQVDRVQRFFGVAAVALSGATPGADTPSRVGPPPAAR